MIRRLILATLASFGLLATCGAPATASAVVAVPQNHGLYGNHVAFATGGSCPPGSSCRIYLSWKNPYVYASQIKPGEFSYPYLSNVDCFYPNVNLWSYSNGLYAAGQIRCFQSSNNGYLTLYGYKH